MLLLFLLISSPPPPPPPLPLLSFLSFVPTAPIHRSDVAAGERDVEGELERSAFITSTRLDSMGHSLLE